MDRQNLTLLTDLYELTMMQGYFKHKDRNETVIFDAFYRNNPCDGGYAIAAGLEQLIKYIKELHFSAEDIDYLAGLGIFEKDFLDYLADFKFSGEIFQIYRRYLCNSGRNCRISSRTTRQSNRSDHGGTACRNRYFEYYQSPESDCH